MPNRYKRYARAMQEYFQFKEAHSHVEIVEVTSLDQLETFARFNVELYEKSPYHVPQLISDQVANLNPNENPSFAFCEAVYYLAYRGRNVVGRIAGIINHRANETWNENNARFAFVDFIDDDEVVDALFDRVEAWARDRGCERIHGPMGFSDMDLNGMLIYGFDQMSTMHTNYNYSYYPRQLQRRGYAKDTDWVEYRMTMPREIPPRVARIAGLVQEKYGLQVKKFSSKKEIMPYAHRIFETLNVTYAPLYGFVPYTPEQIDYYVKHYIPMLRYDFVNVVVREKDDKVVGLGITMPSMSEAMRRARGRLWPFGVVHLLRALYGSPKVVDLLLIGVIPEYQNKGVNALIIRDLIPILLRHKVQFVESQPELENNLSVQRQWESFDKVHHKTRRAYIKSLYDSEEDYLRALRTIESH